MDYKIHGLANDPAKTPCGLPSHGRNLSTDDARVTCSHCLRALAKRAALERAVNELPTSMQRI